MKVWAAVLNIVAVLFLCLFMSDFRSLLEINERDFDQARLNLAVEYATEAMFQKTLEIEDIDTDYSDLSVVHINSSDSLDIFESLMCLNYNMSPSETNMALIEDSIAASVLSSNDGFYITQLSDVDNNPNDEVDGGEKELKWSVKIPYIFEKDGDKYMVNISEEKWAKVEVDRAGITITLPTEDKYPDGITKQEAIASANAQINKAIIKEIKDRNTNQEGFKHKVYLPYETTKYGVNPVKGPGVLMFIQNAKYASTESMDAVSVSGFKVIEKATVVGFTDELGNKYYCYDTQMDPIDIGVKYDIVNYFQSLEAAAEAGYMPHYDLLSKKITKYVNN